MGATFRLLAYCCAIFLSIPGGRAILNTSELQKRRGGCALYRPPYPSIDLQLSKPKVLMK